MAYYADSSFLVSCYVLDAETYELVHERACRRG
jgi:hypothetical protein